MLSELLTSRRAAAGFTQECASKVLGVSRQAVLAWERGKALPTADRWAAIAALYGTTFEEIAAAAAMDAGRKPTAALA